MAFQNRLLIQGSARQCLNLLLMPPPHNSEAETAQPATAITFFDELEIYPGRSRFPAFETGLTKGQLA